METNINNLSPARTCLRCNKGFQMEEMTKEGNCPYCNTDEHAAVVWESPIQLMRYWNEKYEMVRREIEILLQREEK